jgi:hypothetical protein
LNGRNETNINTQVQVVYTDIGGGGCCDPGGDPIIQGEILTEDVQSVELVSVTPEIPGHIYPTYITGKDGKYQFLNIALPTDITISAERNDNYKNGVSTLDIVRIQKHLLGIEQLDSPYDLIAADANNSGSVSAIDLVELRKLILGIYTVLPNNKSWRFVPDQFIGTFNGSQNVDFTAIKVGDVNNTVIANFQSLVTRETFPPTAFTFSPTEYKTNELVNIDFSVEDLKSISGFQFTLFSPDLEFLSASSNLIDIAEDDYALFGDKMTMSWFTLEDVTVHPDDIVFTVKAVAKQAGTVQKSLQLNSDITDAELYSTNGKMFIPKIVTKSDNESQLVLFAPEPSPWASTCTIPFQVQQGGNLIFTVYDVNGTKVFSEEKYYSAGYHEIELDRKDLKQAGLFLYTLQLSTNVQSGKMVLTY